MSEHNERSERIQKMNALRAAGIDPYPAQAERSHLVAAVLDDFEALAGAGTAVALCGRLKSKREHGNLTFATLEDGSGLIQLAWSKADLGAESYKSFLKLIDMGDFLEVHGTLFLTNKGEKTLKISAWKILTKALRPLPDKWYGFKDEEERLRKRYLDIMFNAEARDLVKKRAAFWSAMRGFLVEHGFIEVETPILETTTGGGDARPFRTHHNALDLDVYLRISTGELWQKRLMVAGLEKTFEIGRQFRNEGMDADHLQEYTQVEFYWAYADDEAGMKLVEEMYRYVAQATFGRLEFKIHGHDIDLGRPFERYDYRAIVLEKTGIDITSAVIEDIEAKLKELGVDYDRRGFNITRGIDNLWKYCRKSLVGPGFLVGVPVTVSPLAKRRPNEPGTTLRFQVIIAGSEIGNGYSELNDPIDQAARFAEQQALRESGDEEAQMPDPEFVEALEYGMPPVCGFGTSERLLAYLLNKPMRECQLFPLMKPRDGEIKD